MPSLLRRPHLRGVFAALATISLAAGLTACTTHDVPMEPAADANNPACADVIVRLPNTVAGLAKRNTNAQATGAWGDPEGVLLYCGTEPSGPTSDECVSVLDVDWVIDREHAPLYRFVAYGRTPGLEVIVNSELASGTSTVADLAAAVKLLPQERECVSFADTSEFEFEFDTD